MQNPQHSSVSPTSRWQAMRLLASRFVGSYLVLYSVPPNIAAPMLPGFGWAIRGGITFWYTVLSWVGIHILHIKDQVPPRNFLPGGDTLFGVVRLGCCLVLAAMATLLWTLLDRNGKRRQVNDWVRVYIRYVLGLAMIGYGLAKVIEVQYPPLELDKMLRPLGDLTPMGLLWTFMQGSRIYTLFAGLIEVAAGSLLFLRRTITLGALLCCASMSNVVVMNFGYDIGVKFYSTHLLFMALFLLAPDLGRLADLLILNRPVMPKLLDFHAPARSPWIRYSQLAAKIVIVGIALFGITSANLERSKLFGEHVKPPVFGVYTVEDFRRGDEVIPPLLTDRTRWKKAVFQAMGSAGRSWLSIQMMDDSWQQYRTEYDTNRQTINITDGSEKSKGMLSYSPLDGGQLPLTGTLNSQQLSIRLKRVDDSQYLLLRKNFHLVQQKGNQLFR